MLADVTSPVLETVATVVGVILQVTAGLFVVLPSLFVPNAFICTVLPVLPVSIVGVGGPTASELNVGFTKNPVQLAARAKAPRAMKAPAKRKFFFFDDIPVSTPSAYTAHQLSLDTKIVAEETAAERPTVSKLGRITRPNHLPAPTQNAGDPGTCKRKSSRRCDRLGSLRRLGTTGSLRDLQLTGCGAPL